MNIGSLTPNLTNADARGESTLSQQSTTQSQSSLSSQTQSKSSQSDNAAVFEQGRQSFSASSQQTAQSPESVVIGQIQSLDSDCTVTLTDVSADDPLSMKRYFFSTALCRPTNVAIDRSTLQQMADDPVFRSQVISQIQRGMQNAEDESLSQEMQLHASGVIVESNGHTTVWGWRSPNVSVAAASGESADSSSQTPTNETESQSQKQPASSSEETAPAATTTNTTAEAATTVTAAGTDAQSTTEAAKTNSTTTTETTAQKKGMTARQMRSTIASVKTATSGFEIRRSVQASAIATSQAPKSVTKNELWIQRDFNDWQEYDLNQSVKSISVYRSVLDVVA